MTPFTPPPGYARIAIVDSFEALVATPLAGSTNAVCWRRTLPGDFDEVARHVATATGVAPVDEARLPTLPLAAAGQVAVAELLADLRRLRSIGHEPALECVREYPRDAPDRLVPTDVYSFHVDRAPVATDTFLCSYTGAATEGLCNDEAQRVVDQPDTRARLLGRFCGGDGDAFAAHLQDHNYDLHYAPRAHARPFSFGIGNLWRIAVAFPGSPVPACIHRAPADQPGRPPRLLLIS